MDEALVNEILDELIGSLEALETQSACILQYVKEKAGATEEDLRPYLEQAGNASNVRWRATRARIEHLLAGAVKSAEREQKHSPEPNTSGAAEKRDAAEPGNEGHSEGKSGDETGTPPVERGKAERADQEKDARPEAESAKDAA